MHCLPLAALACLVSARLSAHASDDPTRKLEPPSNLARNAAATASEEYQDLTLEKARDGDLGTRWSGIPWLLWQLAGRSCAS